MAEHKVSRKALKTKKQIGTYWQSFCRKRN